MSARPILVARHGTPASNQALESLAHIEARVWEELARCAAEHSHEWRVCTLATLDANGEADARSVVIREVDVEQRELVFFTDARSPKVAQFAANPKGTLVMWSADLGWQLRLKVSLRVETAGLAVSSRWARLKMKPAAYDYLSPLPPGTPLEHPVPERGSRGHFAVVSLQVLSIDWLGLRAEGQRRAEFAPPAPARWLQP
ncbi:MAG: pyridoxamine 5'-phosphate oxidase family protein [Burkholderiales bacterium]|nr:pyridoxamine 5'-phosphate oxidase family protein [Burkholderiales bacterium]